VQLDRPAHSALPLDREQRPHLVEQVPGGSGEVRLVLDPA
jgi:hypothetical protein